MSIEIANRFEIDGAAASCERYGNGHINETYLVVSATGTRYILQKINRGVFRDVPALMHNIASVCAYLARQDPDPRHSMRIVPPRTGGSFLTDEDGAAWRVYDFVEDSICLDAPETPEDFYQSAVAFGTFQRQLAGFPADTLAETIRTSTTRPTAIACCARPPSATPSGAGSWWSGSWTSRSRTRLKARRWRTCSPEANCRCASPTTTPNSTTSCSMR